MPLSQLAVHVGLSPISQVWLSSFLLILVWPGSCGNAEASSVLLSDLLCAAATLRVAPLALAPRQYAHARVAGLSTSSLCAAGAKQRLGGETYALKL